MALNERFNQVKQRVKALYDDFFYNGQEAPAPHIQDDYAGGQMDPYGQQRRGQGNGAQAQGGYQQPYTQPANPPQHRVRRAQRNSQDNVVDFGAYQHAQAQQQYAAAAQQYPAQGQANAQPPQNYQAPAAQPGVQPPQSAPQPQAPEAPVAPSATFCARIINARGMGDCRSAITLLRKGDSVLIVLENVTDPTEMRRLVDTLSGACYSLTATITKVSRYGVYLLAPQAVPVYADQATSLMNNPPSRNQNRNYPGYGQPQRGYGQPSPYGAAYQQGQANPYMNQAPQANPYMNQAPQANPAPAFTQRAPMPEEAPQNFYQRPVPQEARTPDFSAQPVAYGYAPDETRAAEQ